VTTGEAAMVGGLAIAPEATVVLAGTATATGTTAGVGTAGVAGGAALLTPAGWVVVGVIVVGLAVGATVYLVMRSYDGEANAGAPLAGSGRPGKGSMAPPPRIAPGAGRSDPIVEPDRGAPALVPGLPGSSIAEPEESFPLEAPGSRASEPLELASKRLPPLIDPLHGSGLPGIPPPAVYQSADELREALRNALRATTFGPSDGQSLIDDVRAVIRSGQLPRTPANDILVSMLEDVYRKLGDGAGRRFRQAIANAQGPDVPETARNGRLKPFPWAAWDAVYDVEYGNQINRPETLGQILQQHLGLPRWVP